MLDLKTLPVVNNSASLSLIVPEPLNGDFYLFYITEIIDGFERIHKRLAVATDPKTKAKEMVFEEAGNNDAEWSNDRLESYGNVYACYHWSKITPVEASIIYLSDKIQ